MAHTPFWKSLLGQSTPKEQAGDEAAYRLTEATATHLRASHDLDDAIQELLAENDRLRRRGRPSSIRDSSP